MDCQYSQHRLWGDECGVRSFEPPGHPQRPWQQRDRATEPERCSAANRRSEAVSVRCARSVYLMPWPPSLAAPRIGEMRASPGTPALAGGRGCSTLW